MREKRIKNPRARESGNFMLQALLALSLVIAFMPFMARKMFERSRAAEMNATAGQIRSVIPVAKAFGKDNSDSFVYGVTVFEKRRFSDDLEAFGLPIGFIPRTPFGQDISLIIARNREDILILVRVSDGRMRPIERAELAMRLGFWAAEPDGRLLRGATGGWELDTEDFAYRPMPGSVYVRVPLVGEFSELVARRARNMDESRMHTDLIMGGRDIRNANDVTAREGEFRSVLASNFVLSGIEDGRRFRNRFGELRIRRANFQTSAGGAALNVTRGTLTARSVTAPSISRFGDAGNLFADVVSVYDFSMTAGRTGFSGPPKWEVRENALFENVTMNVERVEISGFINAARGQDVFIDEDTLDFSTKSGIEANIVSATNLTLRDQTSTALLDGVTGPAIIDIRPAGVSVLPDASVDSINNNALEIISSPDDDSGAMTSCRNVISGIDARTSFNQNSLSQNIVCRYVFWQRLEQRIDLKRCLMEGRDRC